MVNHFSMLSIPIPEKWTNFLRNYQLWLENQTECSGFNLYVSKCQGSKTILSANIGVNQRVTLIRPRKGPKEQSFEPFCMGLNIFIRTSGLNGGRPQLSFLRMDSNSHIWLPETIHITTRATEYILGTYDQLSNLPLPYNWQESAGVLFWPVLFVSYPTPRGYHHDGFEYALALPINE